MNDLKYRIASLLYRTRFGEKLLMTLNIWLNDWRMCPPALSALFPRNPEMEKSLEEAEKLYAALDELSRETVRKYIRRQSLLPGSMEDAKYFFYHFSGKLTPEERKKDRAGEKAFRKLRKKYHFTHLHCGEESFLFHHGLKMLPEKVLSCIKGRDFIDAGACFGDSTLSFLSYSPRKIYAFEPSPANGRIYKEIMGKNRVPEERYELVPMGLASRKGEIFFSDSKDSANNLRHGGETRAELVTLDEFVREKNVDAGVIKADLEGMGLDMLKGAKETLMKCRPVLSLSIYHSREELFGIYPFLKESLPDYHFCIRSTTFFRSMGEITLLGYPEELLK